MLGDVFSGLRELRRVGVGRAQQSAEHVAAQRVMRHVGLQLVLHGRAIDADCIHGRVQGVYRAQAEQAEQANEGKRGEVCKQQALADGYFHVWGSVNGSAYSLKDRPTVKPRSAVRLFKPRETAVSSWQ
jgi:hypothetical protein